MIPDDHLGLIEAARAIAAGRRVDWKAIESSGGISDSLAKLLRQLKIVEDIAELHRSLPDPALPLDSSVASAAEDAPDAIAAGLPTWGPLKLLDCVGRGAFGDVFRAWDPRLEREVALKLLRQPSSPHDSVGTMVVDEGRLLARVRHPNVVTVYGADRIDGQVGLWMEFVRGRTIEAVLREHGPFGAQEAALIGLDVCRALSAVHRAGLIHRDIKAHNVVRENGGRIVLMDFGAGRDVLDDAATELAGTPLYLAPEILAGAAATTRSDIYSVGVLLYHLVTGSYPVKGRTVGDLRGAHRRRQRAWLRDERPDLPDVFVRTVERALADSPDERYESVGAMETDLARVVSSGSATSEPKAVFPVTTRLAISGRPRKRSRTWIAAAALGGVALSAVIAARIGLGERILGGSGSSRSLSGAAGAPITVSMRRVPLSDFSFIGSPSPDGKWVSFADANGNVALVDITTGQQHVVTHDASYSDRASQLAKATVVSPDGKSIAFAWLALDGQYELRTVDVEGQQPRVLARDSALDYVAPLQWSRDGRSILTLLVRANSTAYLALVGVEEPAMRVVKELGTSWPQYASLSPDGRFVVYDAPQQPPSPARDIFIVQADGTQDHPLIQHPANDSNPVWTPDGRAVLFVSDRSGVNDIWHIGVDRGSAVGEPQVMHRNVGRMWLRGITDGGSYFFYLTVGAVDVYEARLGERGVSALTSIPEFSGSNISSAWSQDGRYLAYASRRGTAWFDRGSTTLAIVDAQTQIRRDLTPALNGLLVRAWSPDDKLVLVGGTGIDGRPGNFCVDTETAAVRSLELGPRPDWRSDGRITFINRAKQQIVARDVQHNVDEILVDGRAEHVNLIADVLGRGYRLSPDGSTVAYTAAIGTGPTGTRALSIRVLKGGPTRELVRVPAPELITFQDWTADGGAVLFTKWLPKEGTPTTLWRVSIHGGDPQPLGLSLEGLRDVSAHPDGRRITFTAGFPKNELWTIDHFLGTR